MSEYKLTVKLEQYTPLLHFQGDQQGACLRATEVKPKLDRFIVGYLKQHGADIPDGWQQKPERRDYVALRYKLHISAGSEQPANNQAAPFKKLYFADMDSENKGKEPIRLILHDENILTILCFASGMTQIDGEDCSMGRLLEILLPPFFAIHTFGARSSKGFGSYGVMSIENKQPQAISPSRLMEFLPNPDPEYFLSNQSSVFYAEYSNRSLGWESRLNDVVTLSTLTKGGLNFGTAFIRGFIRKYTSLGNARSEKALIKTKILISAAADRDEMTKHPKLQPANPSDPFLYKRGVLGLAQTYEYKGLRKGKVSVKMEDRTIERFHNPILFKPHGKYLFLIPQPIPHKLVEHKAILSNGRHNEAISMPHAFDLTDFLDSFAKWYNRRSDPEFKSVQMFTGGGFDFKSTFARIGKIERA